MRFEYSAGIIIYENQEGEIRLLFLIKDNGEYDIPKGHIEKGETSLIAAKRETKEETGLEVEPIPYFKRKIHYFFYDKKEKVSKDLTYFIAKAESNEVKISYEHKGYVWLTPDEGLEKIKFKDTREMIRIASDYIQRYEKIVEINKEYSALPSKIKEWNLSKRFVPGEGPLDAKIVFVGQAPGRTEDAMLRPFVGRSGMLLGRIMKSAGIKRESVYITSVVQFYPPENRAPTEEEVKMCKQYFERQIEVIRPTYMVLLGNVAASTVTGRKVEVNKMHGTLVECGSVKCFVTFHPAAALRSTGVLELMKKDFMKLKEMAV